MALADYLTGQGFGSRTNGETGQQEFFDPLASNDYGGRDVGQATAQYNRMSAVDDQGRSMWGSSGFPSDPNDPSQFVVNVGGQNMYRLGNERIPGIDPTFDPTHGYLAPLDQYQQFQQYTKQTNTGDDWMDYAPMILAVLGSAGVAAGAAGGAEAGAAGGAAFDSSGALVGQGALPATNVWSGLNLGNFVGAGAGAGAAGGAGGSGTPFDTYPSMGVGDVGGAGFSGGMEGLGAAGDFGGAINPFGSVYDTFSSAGIPQGGMEAAMHTGDLGLHSGELGGGFLDQLGDAWKWYKQYSPYISGANSIFSGISGLAQRGKLADLTSRLASQANPYEASGTGAAARGQLQNLLSNPSSVASTDPAYKLAIQAAMRSAAPYGQASGRMATAAADASNNWYNQRLNTLAPLTGAQFNPAAAGSLQLQGAGMSSDLLSRSLASLAFGGSQLAGSGNDMASLLSRLLGR